MIAVDPVGSLMIVQQKMHTPPHFAVSDSRSLLQLIQEAPLATLVINTAEGLDASHIPFTYHAGDGEKGVLRAHIPRINPLSDALKKATECVLVFNGPEGYVSPSWYATKQAHGRVVPTWNYAVAHVHGTAVVVDDPDWVLDQINHLTDQNEATRTEPWSVSDAPEPFISGLVASLVGLEVSISRIEGKIKASQNQPARNKTSIMEAMTREQPDGALTTLMRQVLDQPE